MNTKKIAFFERNSWNHRTKTLMPDHSVRYGKKGGFKTEEEAEESYFKMEKEFEKAVAKTIIKNKTEVNLKDYLVYWFENIYSSRIEISTKMIGAYTLYSLIFPNIEKDIKLRLVTTDYLDAIIEKSSKVCESAGNKSRELLSIAFKDAVIDGFIRIDPMIGTKIYGRKKRRILILNKEELKKFLGLVYNDGWYLEILLALFCGLRKGEILALTFEDFNLKDCTVEINKQLSVSGKVTTDCEEGYKIEDYTLKTKSPKSQNSYRNIRIPKVIIEEVNTREKYINTLKKDKNFIDKGFISCQSNGKPHSLSSLNTYLKRLCLRNGLPPISVHGLRHMFATILLERNVSIAKISALLGHNSIHTTFEFYCEIMDEKEKIKAFMNSNFTPRKASA